MCVRVAAATSACGHPAADVSQACAAARAQRVVSSYLSAAAHNVTMPRDTVACAAQVRAAPTRWPCCAAPLPRHEAPPTADKRAVHRRCVRLRPPSRPSVSAEGLVRSAITAALIVPSAPRCASWPPVESAANRTGAALGRRLGGRVLLSPYGLKPTGPARALAPVGVPQWLRWWSAGSCWADHRFASECTAFARFAQYSLDLGPGIFVIFIIIISLLYPSDTIVHYASMGPFATSYRLQQCCPVVQVRVAAPVAGAAARVGPHRAAAARHCLRVGGPVSATVGTLSTYSVVPSVRLPYSECVCARACVGSGI